MATKIGDLLPETTDVTSSLDPSKDRYDRSALVGDFMVMIADRAVEEHLRRAPENQSCEDIDGVVDMPSPPLIWHPCQCLEAILAGPPA